MMEPEATSVRAAKKRLHSVGQDVILRAAQRAPRLTATRADWQSARSLASCPTKEPNHAAMELACAPVFHHPDCAYFTAEG